MTGAPEIDRLEDDISGAGFVRESVCVDVKEESRDTIKQWLPGSGAEEYIVSANVSATKAKGTASASAITSCTSTPSPTVATNGCGSSSKSKSVSK